MKRHFVATKIDSPRLHSVFQLQDTDVLLPTENGK